jgi:hypothetical protein
VVLKVVGVKEGGPGVAPRSFFRSIGSSATFKADEHAFASASGISVPQRAAREHPQRKQEPRLVNRGWTAATTWNEKPRIPRERKEDVCPTPPGDA